MGSQVIAKCKCGVNKSLSIGGGLLNHSSTQLFPCYCKNCRDLVGGNLKDEKQLCPECKQEGIKPYNTPELMGVKGLKKVAQSFDEILTDGNYKCPKCELMTLQFIATSLVWD